MWLAFHNAVIHRESAATEIHKTHIKQESEATGAAVSVTKRVITELLHVGAKKQQKKNTW